MSEKLMLIDGNSILNRAFYALQGSRMLSTAMGFPTNAVYGFVNILRKYIDEEKPDYICIAFDLKAPTFRHAQFSGYKAHRKGMPDELSVQVPLIKEVLDCMRICRVESEGFEADDLIGTISKKAELNNIDTVIVTGDRDALQLAGRHTRIRIPTTKAGKADTEEYDDRVVFEKYGVTPLEFIEVKALMGDQSDNIPGVQGIGEKTALELVSRYKSLENIYDSLDTIERKGVSQKLESNKEIAFLSRKIATIDRDVPNICGIDACRFKGFDRVRLYELFLKLEFNTFITKFNLDDSYSQETLQVDIEQPLLGALPQQACDIRISDIHGMEALRDVLINEDVFAVYPLINKSGTLEYELFGIGMFSDGNGALYLDLSGKDMLDAFFDLFKPIFTDSRKKIYGHDLKALCICLGKRSISFEGLSFDTGIAAYVLNPSKESYRIEHLSSLYLGTPLESLNSRQYSCMMPDSIAGHAAGYAQTVFRLFPVMHALLEQNKQERLYYDIELPLIRVLAEMELYGFKVDIGGLHTYSAELGERLSELTASIHLLAGEPFNINSPKQLGHILFDKLGMPAGKKTKTGFSTNVEVLEQLASENDIIKDILVYRQLSKLKSTYAEGLLNAVHPETYRIHSSFNQTVTATGRISSTEPNMQNIPVKLDLGRKIRKVFIPEDEDYILCTADYSQIELRILAHISEDENLISDFADNLDIHAATASKVFKVPIGSVTGKMRSRAKAVNFGIIYGIGDFSLSRDLGISRKEAREYIDSYLDMYPGVRRYMKDIVAEAKQRGYVTTLLNRRRYIPELKSGNFATRSFGERIALNTPIQGSAADIIKIAMVKVRDGLKAANSKSRLILQVHDELIIEARITEIEEVKALLKDAMETALSLKVPLIAEIKLGSDWYEAK